jgi:hypothetical protein
MSATTQPARRSFLGALLAAPVVAAVPAIAAQAPLVAPVVEVPELLGSKGSTTRCGRAGPARSRMRPWPS